MGGFAGSHAEYIRVPFADVGAFTVPERSATSGALFASDSAADRLDGRGPGRRRSRATSWRCGARAAVGQMAARAAMLLGAERVIAIDRFAERLRAGRASTSAPRRSTTSATDVAAELRSVTGGRGPDVCIEAVGMEAHSTGPQFAYDQVKQQLRLQTDRPTAIREAIYACRKGGSVFVLGVFAGFVDKFPLGAVMNKGLTLRGAQQHGQRYIPMLLERMARGELTPRTCDTPMRLEDGPGATRCSSTRRTVASARCSRPRSDHEGHCAARR